MHKQIHRANFFLCLSHHSIEYISFFSDKLATVFDGVLENDTIPVLMHFEGVFFTIHRFYILKVVFVCISHFEEQNLVITDQILIKNL